MECTKWFKFDFQAQANGGNEGLKGELKTPFHHLRLSLKGLVMLLVTS
jgi:hypothetical protein